MGRETGLFCFIDTFKKQGYYYTDWYTMAYLGLSTKRATRIADRQRQVGDLYLARLSQPEIASRLRISQKTVSVDLKALRKQWLASALMDFNEAKARELAQIDKLEDEAYQAWERSKQVKKTETSEKIVGGKLGDSLRAAVVKEDQYGDPRFLAIVDKCIERRTKILGLEDADRRENTWREWLMANGYADKEKELYGRLVRYFAENQAGLESAVSSGSTSGSPALPAPQVIDITPILE